MDFELTIHEIPRTEVVWQNLRASSDNTEDAMVIVVVVALRNQKEPVHFCKVCPKNYFDHRKNKFTMLLGYNYAYAL